MFTRQLLRNNALFRVNLRKFSTQNTPKPTKSKAVPLAFLTFTGLGAASYFYYQQSDSKPTFLKKPLNYQEVYNKIADILEDVDYDDGSYGPVFLRLAWHAAGTYDLNTNTGGSNGSTMRFNPESSHGANAGLKIARDRLEQVKKEFPAITHADLWSLAGVVAIQEAGGPIIKWRPGRKDADSETACTPDGRLPDAALGQDHEDKATKELMMLPADLAFINDKKFKSFVTLYAKDEKKFFEDFAYSFQKLEELGVPFDENTKPMVLKPTF
ncbi:heme peroxidase [Clydaea vesicula]|uniref:Peroxidase n=1 Tax=Clydaea vesicula TaxID=447962 RepID=A0AAD5U223_9FUNG|nr:heme peroxidase [Clydaea vesicula]